MASEDPIIRTKWHAATWNELEPFLRENLEGLELTEWEYGYGGEQFKVARDRVEVARDILNALEAGSYIVVNVQV